MNKGLSNKLSIKDMKFYAKVKFGTFNKFINNESYRVINPTDFFIVKAIDFEEETITIEPTFRWNSRYCKDDANEECIIPFDLCEIYYCVKHKPNEIIESKGYYGVKNVF